MKSECRSQNASDHCLPARRNSGLVGMNVHADPVVHSKRQRHTPDRDGSITGSGGGSADDCGGDDCGCLLVLLLCVTGGKLGTTMNHEHHLLLLPLLPAPAPASARAWPRRRVAWSCEPVGCHQGHRSVARRGEAACAADAHWSTCWPVQQPAGQRRSSGHSQGSA